MKVTEVIERAAYLQQLHRTQVSSRQRIQAIMDGGAPAVAALLGADANVEFKDIPMPLLLMRAMTVLSQKIGRKPTLKVPAVSPQAYSQPAEENAQLRKDIIESYDEEQKLHLDLRQQARWVLGYGFGVNVLQSHVSQEGFVYPVSELRDPFDCYPGHWGVRQRPEELAIIRRVPIKSLIRSYPHLKSQLEDPTAQGGSPSLSAAEVWRQSHWENPYGDGVSLVEYYDDQGTHIVVPERNLELDFIPNPLESGPAFVIPKRFSFNKLNGHYDHAIGLLVAMVKLTILGVIAMEDAVFVETNVVGEVLSGKYRKGRGETNILAQGSKVERPQNNLPFQMFQQIDRVERQLRVNVGYPVQDDGESPIDFATGRGVETLGIPLTLEVREYHDVFRSAIQDLDSKRLEWDELCYPGISKPLLGLQSGKSFYKMYDPAIAINGRRRTNRNYGVMAGWDEPAKIVTGIQMLVNEMLDTQTFQENIDGFEDVDQINERIRREKAENSMWQMLNAEAADPNVPPPERAKAKLMLTRILENPEDFAKILVEFNTPDEPQPAEEDLAFLGEQEPDPLAAAFGGGGAPPGVSTVLSRLEQSGGAEGGVQTVNRV